MAQLQSTGVTGSLTVTGQITAQTLSVQQITSSILVVTGSNKFGSLPSNTQEFTGSLVVTGSGPHYIIGGNVGIGTTSPSQKLDVKGSAGNGIRLTHSNNNEIGFLYELSGVQGGGLGLKKSDATQTILLNAGGDSYITGGKVGIGLTNPDAILDVSHTAGSTNIIRVSNGAGNYRWRVDQFFNMFMTTAASVDSVGIYNNGNAYFTGNVGIGSTVPAYKLDVNGDIRIAPGLTMAPSVNGLYALDGTLSYYSTSNGVYLNGAGTNGWLRLNGSGVENYQNCIDIYGSAGARIEFRTGNSERMRITSGGNVGIGTTSPTSTLNVNGNMGFAGDTTKYLYMPDINQGTGSIYMQAGFGSATAGGALRLYGHNATTYTGGDVEVGLSGKGNFLINTYIGGTRLVTVTVGGNVGIGTTIPYQILHVNGNILLDGIGAGYSQSATRGIGYGSNSGAVSIDGFSGMDIQSVNAPAPYNGNYSQNVRFFTHHYGAGTGGTPRMFIQYDGNVGIGTTSPGSKFEIKSSAANNLGGLLLRATSTSNFPAILYENSSNGGTLDLYNVAALTTRINSNGDSYFNGGNVGIGTTVTSYNLDILSTTTGVLRIKGTGQGYTQASIILQTDASVDTPQARGLGVYAFNEGNDVNWYFGTPYRIAYSDSFVVNRKANAAFDIAAADPLDAANFLIISSSGNIGIGTTDPTKGRVQINTGAANNNAITLQATSQTSITYGLGIDASSNFAIYDNFNSAQRITMNGDGNVGIGTTSPLSRLHITNLASGADGLEYQRWSYTAGSVPNYSLILKQTVTANVVRYNFSMINNATAYNNVLVLDRGNVGIGVTDPTTKLHVDGTVSGSAFQLGPLQYAARRYSSTVANITTGSYTTLFNVYGDALSSAVRVVIRGTANSVVVDSIIDITANHSEDIVIKSQSGIYTILTIKVLAAGTNTEDFTVQAKINYHIDGQPLTANVDVYPYGNEIIEFNPGSIYSVTVLEHECSAGFNHSATGGTNYFNVNNGNVGIGTTTPAVKLEAQGNGVRLRLSTTSAPTTYYFDIESNYDSTNSVNFYGTGGNNFLKYVFNNNQLLLQPSAGNVGIGTTTAGAKLDVNGRIRLGSNSYTEIYSSGNRVLFRSDDVDNVGQFASYGLFLPQTGQSYNLYLAGGMQLGYTDSSPIISMARGSSGAVTYVQIASNGSSYFNGGSVGIGTTSPTSTLHVVGNARVGAVTGTTANHTIDLTAGGSGGNAYIDFGYYGTFDAAIWLAGYWGDASGTFKIKDASSGTPADRFVITQGSSPSITFPAGSVGIGTTSPGFILDVGGRMRIRNGGGTAGTWYNNAANNATVFFTGLISDTAWGVWDGSEWIAEFNTSNNFISKGDVIAYGSPSDIRLKDIKSTVSNALDSVLKLNGYKFDWKPSDSILQIKEDIGVIAQEVEEVFPELVRENESTGMKSVRYQGLIPVLIEAVKEQQKQIDELKYLLKNKQNGN